MELSIASHGGKNEPFMEHKKEKFFGQKTDKPINKPTKEAMTIDTVPVKISTQDKNKEVKRMEPSREVIKLPECKRPEEMNWVNYPKFCKYHRIELIMNLAMQGRTKLDVDKIADANVATIVIGSFDLVSLPTLLPRLEFQSTRGIH
ncbi:unnamed protein product [Prunus armeniaca]